MSPLSVQHFTATTQTEADEWFAEKHRELEALKAAPSNDLERVRSGCHFTGPSVIAPWYQRKVALYHPRDLKLEAVTTHSNGYIYCQVTIGVDESSSRMDVQS